MVVAVKQNRSMWRRPGPMRWVGILVVSGAVAALAPCRTWGEEPEAVARVNGEPVTRAELQRMIQNPITLRQAQALLGVEHPDAAAVEGLALRRLVHLHLLVQEGRRRKIEVTDRELNQEIASLRRRFEDLHGFGAWMAEQGLDDRSLFQTIRGDMAADRVRAALVEGVRVSEEDVARYYVAHQNDFRREDVRLQIIAAGDEATANEIVAALRKGVDFGQVARQRSRGLHAAQGGDTGWVESQSIASPLRETVAALEPRQTRGPLQRGSDFLIVRLNDRRLGEARSLADVRPDIERRLQGQKRSEALEAWLAEQEKTAKIELLYRPAGGAGPTRPGGEGAAATTAERR